MKKLGVIIINRNNLKYTQDCLADLNFQTNKNFEVTLVDNGSSEKEQKYIIENLGEVSFVANVIINKDNRPLNHLWNEFSKFGYEYLCFLNNDVRLPDNFIDDTIRVLDENQNIGCVAHSTNHHAWKKQDELEFVTFNNDYRQGWDFTMRNDSYVEIPKQLHFFCGDDWLFENLYKKNHEFAIITSSPIIHFQGVTKRIKGISNKDIREYKKLGFKHPNLDVNFKYSRFKPNKI